MKIKINNQESYELELGNEISLQELQILVDRLYKVVRIFGKDDIVMSAINTSIPKVRRASRKRFPEAQRMEMFKIYILTQDREELKAKLATLGVTTDDVNKMYHYYKAHGKIKPEDFGLTEFPSFYQRRWSRR